jgi:outer membrane protein OmpA-like peptidoglycan-associated protein/tetratricopeptide (TPR) repeat protein
MRVNKREFTAFKNYTKMRLHILSKTTIVLLICFSIFHISNISAENNPNNGNSKMQSSLLKKADLAYIYAKYAIAVDYLNSYLQSPLADKKMANAKLANCYWEMREFDKALKTFQLIYPNGNQDAKDIDKQRIAELYAREGKYKLASEWLKDIKGYERKALSYSKKRAIDNMKRDSLDWKIGFTNINTTFRDFSPFIHNNNLYFSSNKNNTIRKKAFGWDGNNYAQLWQIALKDVKTVPEFEKKKPNDESISTNAKLKNLAGVFENGDNKSISIESNRLLSKTIAGQSNSIGSTVNGPNKQKLNAGAIAIDKNNHFYFSSNYPKPDKNGVNRICLMEGVITKNGVENISTLNFGDPNSYSVMHPAVNNEGTILVFSSNKPNGFGGCDLYYATRENIKLAWSEAKLLGSKINTTGNEVFPAITPDGKLYFSSDVLPGLGGLDIYQLPLQEAIAGNGNVVHLSYPINSAADDFGFTQDTEGKNGFFTSDRLNSDDNIYNFTFQELPKDIYKNALNIEGFVLDKQTLLPLKNSTVFMYSIAEDSVYITKTDEKGKYVFPLIVSSKVVIKAIDKAYTDDCLSALVDIENANNDSIEKAPKDLLLTKYKVGAKWKLNNIRYDFDKYYIRADARPTLDSVVDILNKYPINVELGSHTDSRGSFAYNVVLAENRAKAAVAYIVKKGIDPKRITAKGYGEYQLLNKCADGVPCSEAAHQANRRTEVKVTELPTVPNATNSIDYDKFKAGSVISKDILPKGFFEDCK